VSPRAFQVLTHRRPSEVTDGLERLIRAAEERGIELRFDAEETAKHGLTARPGLALDADDGDGDGDGIELAFVLGGDGTILRALRRFSGTDVPVLAINFGEVGFLATFEADQLEEGIRRACAGDYELMRLPGLVMEGAEPGADLALNDVSFHRRAGERVAELAYSLDGSEVGSVRCDGLVVSTPAGSTGYNLANGGPVLAWGVAGFVVSFIAPHALTARALVAAPSDVVTVRNRSQRAVDVSLDGRLSGELAPGGESRARFVENAGLLAQLPGSSFYRRLREKFGELSR
jgi:NAD+ kinase